MSLIQVLPVWYIWYLYANLDMQFWFIYAFSRSLYQFWMILPLINVYFLVDAIESMALSFLHIRNETTYMIIQSLLCWVSAYSGIFNLGWFVSWYMYALEKNIQLWKKNLEFYVMHIEKKKGLHTIIQTVCIIICDIVWTKKYTRTKYTRYPLGFKFYLKIW